MKHNFLLMTMVAVLLYHGATAQEETGEFTGDNRGREKLRAAHAAYITQRIALTPSEAEQFWPVYREYQEKRRALRQPLREARQKDTDDETLLEMDLRIKQEELDLEKVYIERLQKIIPSEKLIELRQAEADFRKLLLRQLQQRRSGRH